MRKKPTKQYIESQRKKNHIYQTALSLFMEYGYNNVSILDISEASNMSVGSIYNYYRSKIGIVQRISEETAVGVPALLTPTPENLQNPVQTITDAFCNIGCNIDTNLTRDITKHFRDVREEDYILPPERHMWSNISACLADFIRAAKEKGTVSTDQPPEDIADYILSVLHGCIINWTWQQMGMYQSLTENIRAFFPLAIHFISR